MKSERMLNRRVLRRILVPVLLASGLAVATHMPASAVDTTTTTTLSRTPNPSVFGQAVTLTATVTGAIAPTGGTVQFFDGATSLGSVALAGGTASLPVSTLSVGSHTLKATYSGATGFTPSTSANVAQKVNKADSATAIVSSLNPSVRGEAVTFTATVSAVAPGAGVPTGSVEFRDAGRPVATVPLTAGSASHTTSGLSAGNHGFIAVYSGDANFKVSRSLTVVQKVNAPSITLTSPTDATSWAKGTTQNITWTYTDAPGTHVKIRLFKGANNLGAIVASTPIGAAGAGSFAWEIPTTAQVGDNFRIEVIVIGAAAVNDKSETFSLT